MNNTKKCKNYEKYGKSKKIKRNVEKDEKMGSVKKGEKNRENVYIMKKKKIRKM